MDDLKLTHIRQSSEPHRVEITSYNGWTHPDWDPSTLSSDIGLIELPAPVEWSDYIKPVCLPGPGDAAEEGELVTCAGWGQVRVVTSIVRIDRIPNIFSF